MSHQLATTEIYKYSKPANNLLKPSSTDHFMAELNFGLILQINNGKVTNVKELAKFLTINDTVESLNIKIISTVPQILRIQHFGHTTKPIVICIEHSCHIVEEIYSTNTTICINYDLSPNAKLMHDLVHVGLIQANYYTGTINLARDASYISNILNIACQDLQVNMTLNLNEANATCFNKILNYAKPNNNIDILMLLNHNASFTYSNTIAHAIAQDNACSSLLGKIYVEKNLKQVNADLQIKNLVDAKNATCNSRPQLEIYSDDVKCSHGATTGSLDNEAIYYLQARGIPSDLAKQLLRKAFISNILTNIKIEPLKDYIYNVLNLDQL